MLLDQVSGARSATAVARFQLAVATAGVPLFATFERTMLFLLVLRQCLGFRDGAPCRPISTLAIATSVGRPYATVWRQVRALVSDGFLVVEARRVVIARGVRQRADVIAFEGALLANFRDALLDISGPNDPAVTDLDDQVLLSGAIDLLLCVLCSECSIDWADLCLIGYVELHGEPASTGSDRPSKARFSLRQMASDLGLPYSTVHRRVNAMMDGGTLKKEGVSIIVTDVWLATGEGALRAAAVDQCVRRLKVRLGLATCFNG